MKFLILLTLIFSQSLFAEIRCKTQGHNKEFVIVNSLKNFRSIASSSKTIHIALKNQIIHIENKDEFSELNDYLIIKGKKNREVIYSINCQNEGSH